METLRDEVKIIEDSTVHRGFLIDMEKFREDGARGADSAVSAASVLDIKKNIRVALVDDNTPEECIQVILFWTDW